MRKTTYILLALLALCLTVGVIHKDPDRASGVEIQGLDTIGLPGESIRFRFRVTRPNWFGLPRAVPSATVRLIVEGRAIGGSRTDAKGDAWYELAFDHPGRYIVEGYAEVNGKEYPGTLMAFIVPSHESFVVVDMDDAIAKPESKIADWLHKYTGRKPREGAAAALQRIDEYAHIAYLTKRGDGHVEATRAWLEVNDFPRGPVFHKDWEWYGGSLFEHNRLILESIVSRWRGTSLAVVDSRSTATVCRGFGLECLWIADPGEDASIPAQIIPVPDWRRAIEILTE